MKNNITKTILSILCIAILLVDRAGFVYADDLVRSIEETNQVEPVHEHTLTYSDNMDGTHTISCSEADCDYTETEQHIFDDTVVCVCGLADPDSDTIEDEVVESEEAKEEPETENRQVFTAEEADPAPEEKDTGEKSKDDIDPPMDPADEEPPAEPEAEELHELKAFYGASEFIATGSFPETAELIITVLDKEDIAYVIEDDDYIIYEAYDISVMVDGTEWEPEDENTVNVVIKNVKMPEADSPYEEIDYSNTTVLHIDDEDNVEAFPCDVLDIDGGYQSVEFETTGFSTFVIGGYTYNTDNCVRVWNVGPGGSSDVKAYLFYLNNFDDSDGYKLIITGSGPIRDFGAGDMPPWTENPYKDALKSASIENGITTIGGCLFYSCSNLYSVDITASVTEIRDYAFCSCGNLVIDWLPDSITSIGYCSFYACSSMPLLKLPDSCTTLKEYAFAYCSNVIFETIPEGITVIPDHAFTACYKINFPIMPRQITSIGDSAFEACTGFRQMLIKSNVTHIGRDAFKTCFNITRLDLVNVTLDSDYVLTVTHYDPDNNYYETLEAGTTYTITLTRDKKTSIVKLGLHFDDAASAPRPYWIDVAFGVLYPSGEMKRIDLRLGDMTDGAPNIYVQEPVDMGYTKLCSADFDLWDGYSLAGVAINDTNTTIDYYFRGQVAYTVSLPALIDDVSEDGAITVSGTFPESQVLRVRNVADSDHMTELRNENGDALKIKFDSFSPGGFTALLGEDGWQYQFRAFYGENKDGYLDFGNYAPDYSYDLLGMLTTVGYEKPRVFPTDPDVVNYYYHPIAYAGSVGEKWWLFLAKEISERDPEHPTSDTQEANNGKFSLFYAVENTAENTDIIGNAGTIDGDYILFKDKHLLPKLGYDAGTYEGNLVFSWSVEENPYYELGPAW